MSAHPFFQSAELRNKEMYVFFFSFVGNENSTFIFLGIKERPTVVIWENLSK